MSLINIQGAIVVVIEFSPNLLHHRVYDVANVLIVFLLLVFRHLISLFFLLSNVSLFL